jgi:hypothetical protein
VLALLGGDLSPLPAMDIPAVRRGMCPVAQLNALYPREGQDRLVIFEGLTLILWATATKIVRHEHLYGFA